ncbi:MAG TPA: TolC family protein, partial [Chitinophagales bacterium]|nr:TolC family protein [Chitinophagales bacterium]
MMRLKIFLVAVLLSVSAFVQAQEMSLQDAIQLALQNNYDIRIARSQQDIAASQNTAGNAGLLPSISASAGYSAELLNSEQQFVTGD